MSPTQLTLRALRDDGYIAEVVEKRIPRINRLRDLFNIGDVLAIREIDPPLLIQTTTMSNRGARIRKAKSMLSTEVWIKTGAIFEVWAWRKLKGKWACAKTEFYLQDGKVMYSEVT